MEKTLQNLCKAFIGESQARNRYTYYAKIAKKEGYEQIAEIFLVTADQEKIHAKRLFEHIQEVKKKLEKSADEEIKVEGTTPTAYGNTQENLQAAINGEHYEHVTMYPEFAKIADEEGLPEVAERMKNIAKAEIHHEERYQKLLDQLKAGTFFKKEKEVWWICRECGYAIYAKEPPVVCPSCDHPKAYYELRQEDY